MLLDLTDCRRIQSDAAGADESVDLDEADTDAGAAHDAASIEVEKRNARRGQYPICTSCLR